MIEKVPNMKPCILERDTFLCMRWTEPDHKNICRALRMTDSGKIIRFKNVSAQEKGGPVKGGLSGMDRLA